MKLQVHHQTEFRYDRPVHHSIHELRLTPQNYFTQEIIRWRVNAPSKVFESIDAFGNAMQSFVMGNNYSELIIEAKGEVETKNEYLIVDQPKSVSPYYLLQQTDLTNPNGEMIEYFKKITPSVWNELSLVHLTKNIGDKIQYVTGVTNSKTLACEAFLLGKGVCQDQAHLMLSFCRYSGIPARYVSGYVYDADKPVDSTHAWIDVCLNIDQAEWISVDITNQCLTNDCHVRLAVGRDHDHIAPVKGVRSGGGEESLITNISLKEC
jgi:transglutaminase-like putative cysteine protease